MVKTILNRYFTPVLMFFVLLLSIIFNYLSIKHILLEVYKWHLHQPQTYQGGIEISVLFIIFCVSNYALRSYRKTNIFIWFLLSILYLRLHATDVPVLTAIVYFEMIMSLGNSLKKLLKIEENENDSIQKYLTNFVLGISVWCLFAIILSGLGFGNYNELRILTVVLFGLSLIKGINKPFTYTLLKKVEGLSTKEKNLVAFLIIIILVQFAKSSSAFDYDSLWYGLRPQLVLTGNNSFFDNLGLVTQVFVYPKLMEFFFIPISNLGDFSFIYCANTLIFVFIILTLINFLRSFKVSKLQSLWGVLLIATLPVFNMASTAKPDILALFLFLQAAYNARLWIDNYSKWNLTLTIVASELALAVKVTNWLYIPLLIFGIIIIVLKEKKLNFHWIIDPINYLKHIIIVLLGLIDFILMCLRTFVLTGYPVYPVIFGPLWKFIGFQAKYPFNYKTTAGNPQSQTFWGLIGRWEKMFFEPKSYGHIIMLWTGNIGLYLIGIFFIMLFLRKISIKGNEKYFFLFIPVVLSGLFYGSLFVNGGDGNYYLPPLSLALILLLGIIFKTNLGKRIILVCSLAIFILVQSVIMFVSHPSWSWGTSSFSTNLFQSIYDSDSVVKNNLEFAGLTQIAKYVSEGKGTKRAIGFGQEQILNQLPCRFEHIPGIVSPDLGNPSIGETVDSFSTYLKWAKINYIIIPKSGIQGFKAIQDAISIYAKLPKVTKIETKTYILYDISYYERNH